MKVLKYLLVVFSLFLFSCSREDSNCKQTWEFKEYCKKTYNCGSCFLEYEASVMTYEFKCNEVNGIKEGTEVHLSERDTDCFKFYRRYIKKIN